MKIYIASDHAGFELKSAVIASMSKNYEIIDLGVKSREAVDYPDYADLLADNMLQNPSSFGILICGSGIGISIAANRHKHIRAALCRSEKDAELAREHNDANSIVLGACEITENEAINMIQKFLKTAFAGGRHEKRVEKLGKKDNSGFFTNALSNSDQQIADAIQHELKRQQDGIELIASENIVSRAVLEAQGSIMTNKYAEGYPHKRYYGGCEFVDIAEELAIARAKQLFDVKFVNVQPHSGSQANQAVYAALLQPHDTILGMSLDAGGHLTHGAKVNLSGKWLSPIQYGVSPETGLIDMDEVRRLAKECKSKLIIAGGSAYPRVIDFAAFRKIADEVGAYLMVDMAHFAGLVAGGAFPSPIPHAHIITTTTHKTLRGPRGGMILTNDEDLAKKINSAIFPGIQGGPLMHVIAAKAVAFGEALRPEFKTYAKAVVENSKTLATTLEANGFKIFTDGTDCHLMLVDLRTHKITGKDAENSLCRSGLTCNKNAIPFDTEKPFITSGIRLGSPAATTRGFGRNEFVQVGEMIAEVLEGLAKNGLEGNTAIEKKIMSQVLEICSKFPIYI